jgi:hypothetical protein
VNPRQTTTYVLTVHGPRDQMLTQEVTVTIPGTAPLKTATPVKREIPKMPDGKPNLSGVYNMIFPGQFLPGRRSHEHFEHAWSARNDACR